MTQTRTAPTATTDDPTVSMNAMRTGWDPNQPQLAPSQVGAADFGQLFSTAVDGQVYAQPVVVGTTVVVATENNKVYGIHAVTGGVLWSRSLGAPLARVGDRLRRPGTHHRRHLHPGL